MAHPQVTPILSQMEDTSVQVSHLESLGGCHIWRRAPGLTSMMVQGKLELWPHFGSLAFI